MERSDVLYNVVEHKQIIHEQIRCPLSISFFLIQFVIKRKCQISDRKVNYKRTKRLFGGLLPKSEIPDRQQC